MVLWAGRFVLTFLLPYKSKKGHYMENTNTGWVKLHRKIEDNPISTKPDYFRVWIYLLLNANHKENTFIWNNKKETLKPGQLITGRKKIAEKTGVNESQVYKILKYLELEQQIEQQTTTKYTVITILNWDKYQSEEQQSNNRVTTTQQQSNTNKNVKNEENDKNISKDMEAKAPDRRDEFIERIQKGMRSKYPYVLEGLNDRRRLYNLKQVMTPRKGRDTWMEKDPIANFNKFIKDYFKYEPDDRYKTRKLIKLMDIAKEWREREGKLVK